jgi:hypothetical protein
MKLFSIRIRHKHIYSTTPDQQALAESMKQAEADLIASLKGVTRNKTDTETWQGNLYIMDEQSMMTTITEIGIDADTSPSGIYICDVKLLMEVGDPTDAIKGLIDKMELAAARFIDHATIFELNGKDVISGNGWNDHAQAPISGHHLVNVNELLLCENYCTDALQDQLTEGWRILAVCPQEARRPDYVLGRCNPQFNKSHAGRG